MRLIDADPFGVVSFQGKSEDFIEGALFILDKIDEAPTVEERPHGEWIETDNDFEIYGNAEKCTNCGEAILSTHMRYCGNCGAYMGGESE